MEHLSIIDHSSPSPGKGDAAGVSPSVPPPSVSAQIAAANVHSPKTAEPGLRFPAEDGGQSLAAMAEIDLDATLQLLADRAQYITGASGAAIALRRGHNKDMVCRASAGTNAPELGALLSMEYGLSGESVRTRQTLRCDDTERDPRVNRQGCRELGIASVIVMPIVSEEQTLGVFELFSGQPNVFGERDISALRRLSEMVETAARHAAAAQQVLAEEAQIGENRYSQDPVANEVNAAPVAKQINTAPTASGGNGAASISAQLPPVGSEPATTKPRDTGREVPAIEIAQPESAPKKPLFWSAAMQSPAGAAPVEEKATPIPVPPVLRNLQKCQACGFPVSQGRILCVECQEKQWRGLPLPPARAGSPIAEPLAGEASISAATNTGEIPENLDPASASPHAIARPDVPSSPQGGDLPQNVQEFGGLQNSTLFSSATAQPESWLLSKIFILGGLLVVALVLIAIAWMR